ncbi:MAG: 3-deoxy-manno-octulosonate cytidylyltransferase [Flavobacteriales bacterium]|nr:3-deoxy-manno-octulosonate cytidylyltransferase [Flavobacteriales bacterium]|tara:strand:- start:4246 stop:4953 length:708 start_codon:yes stop_codon:yes gene_type:complete
MHILGIIPSRFASKRLPGKPLINISGKSMIQRVYEQCEKSLLLNQIVVATDDKRIYKHVNEFGGNVVMTSITHESGTDRCNEVVLNSNMAYDIVVNIQGDEPFINPIQIDQVVANLLDSNADIATLAKKIDDLNVIFDANNPKIIFNKKTKIADDFVRKIDKINKNTKYYKHIGIYAFKTEVLNEISKLSQTEREMNENLEQLRWIENNYQILVGITDHESVSIDTREDLKKLLI